MIMMLKLTDTHEYLMVSWSILKLSRFKNSLRLSIALQVKGGMNK